MVDFEDAAEREDIERPENLDPGVGPDPVPETPAPDATAATADGGAGAVQVDPVGQDGAPPTGGEQLLLDFGPVSDDGLPLAGAGFNYGFGVFG